MEQRYQAVLAVIRDGVAVVARRVDVSRQAVHRWLRSYKDQGIPGWWTARPLRERGPRCAGGPQLEPTPEVRASDGPGGGGVVGLQPRRGGRSIHLQGHRPGPIRRPRRPRRLHHRPSAFGKNLHQQGASLAREPRGSPRRDQGGHHGRPHDFVLAWGLKRDSPRALAPEYRRRVVILRFERLGSGRTGSTGPRHPRVPVSLVSLRSFAPWNLPRDATHREGQLDRPQSHVLRHGYLVVARAGGGRKPVVQRAELASAQRVFCSNPHMSVWQDPGR